MDQEGEFLEWDQHYLTVSFSPKRLRKGPTFHAK